MARYMLQHSVRKEIGITNGIFIISLIRNYVLLLIKILSSNNVVIFFNFLKTLYNNHLSKEKEYTKLSDTSETIFSTRHSEERILKTFNKKINIISFTKKKDR